MTKYIEDTPAAVKPFSDKPEPPCDNMGVLDTIPAVFSQGVARHTEKPLSGYENTISIDWLSFTVPADDWRVAASILGLSASPWEYLDRGLLGYQKQMQYQGIKILYDGFTLDDHGAKISMGVHCICSGATLVHVPLSMPAVFERVALAGGKCTRIDVAIDDYKGLLSREKILTAYENHHFTTKAREFQVIEGKRIVDDVLVDEGFTFYSGRRNGAGKRRNASETLLRIYQKDAEQRVEYHWWRVELQVRGSRAQNLGLLLSSQTERLEKYAVDLIRSYFQFREPGNDSNRGRWRLASWWDDLLAGAELLRLGWSKIRRPDMADKMRWMSRQVVKSLGQIATYFGPGCLAGLAAEGLSRITQEDCKAVGFSPLPKFRSDLWAVAG